MATISPNPKFRAFDSNGDPLSGGLLYTYEAGTTTPKATYTTEAGDVANANPVVLDSDGYADVWLGDGGYKFVLKTSADVTIWTVDDLGGTSSVAFGSNVNDISTNTAITTAYVNSINICTSSPTLSLLAASTAGEGFYFNVKNNGAGTVTIDPDASEQIDGASTLTIAAGDSALIICNGTAWYSLFHYPVVNEFSDSTFRIQDNSDATKKIAFEASGITTGTTRTATMPDKSGTLAMISDIPVPSTRQYLTSGTAATYTTPTGCTAILVRAWGAGGGGGATITNNGASGGNTIFNAIEAAGGAGGTAGGSGSNPRAGGAGGSAGTGTATFRMRGNSGSYSPPGISGISVNGGNGGVTALGGNGVGAATGGTVGGAAVANSGSGGGGAVSSGSGNASAGGGGAGEYFELYITSPAATYTYTIGAAGAGGAAGTNAGGDGGSGMIIVEEFY